MTPDGDFDFSVHGFYHINVPEDADTDAEIERKDFQHSTHHKACMFR